MPRLIITYPLRQGVMTSLTAVGGVFEGAGLTVGLITDTLNSADTRTTRAAVLNAEPTNVTFPGYAAKTPVVWGTQFRDGSDNVYRDAGEYEWIANADPPAPLNIIGAYWDDGVNVVLYLFDAPQVITRKDDAAAYVPVLPYGQ